MFYNLWRDRLLFLTLSGVFFLLSVWVTPDRLIPLGIMDLSLMSENELTRRTTLLEISIAKYACFALGSLFLGLFFIMPTLKRSSGYQAFMSRDLLYPKPYEDGLNRVYDKALILILSLIVLSFMYLALAETLFSPEFRRLLHREDGIIEYTSAVLLILAAFYAGYTGIFASKVRPASRGFHLFLALLFFAMCGEEISWGQRIFDYGTPDSLAKLNVQNEANLHNMFGYVFDHLFILLFFIWGCILPFLFHTSHLSAQIIRWSGVPIPSIGLAIGMFLITLYQDKIVFLFVDGVRGLRIPELRELLSATAFLVLMQQSRVGFVSRN